MIDTLSLGLGITGGSIDYGTEVGIIDWLIKRLGKEA